MITISSSCEKLLFGERKENKFLEKKTYVALLDSITNDIARTWYCIS